MEDLRVSFKLGADAERKLPAGRLEYTMAGESVDDLAVRAAYLKIPDRDGSVARSISTKDGAIVIDFDAHGRLMGLEVLDPRCLGCIRRERRFFRDVKTDREVMAALFTAMTLWGRVDAALQAMLSQRKKSEGLVSLRQRFQDMLKKRRRIAPPIWQQQSQSLIAQCAMLDTVARTAASHH